MNKKAQVAKKDEHWHQNDCREELTIFDSYKQHKEYLTNMLSEFTHVRDGHLGLISTAQNRMELTSESILPVYCVPHRAVLILRKFSETEINKMVEVDVIKPTATEWTSPRVFVPKKYGSLRFRVDYRKLNTVIIREHHSLSCIEEWID